jgi:Tol biopolymer transport system component
MGEVYRARDSVLRREVALKTLLDKVTREPDRLARLRREARILASLSHPGIATLHGLEESDGVPFLVMELVPGETLSDRLRRRPFALKEALQISQQVAEALAAAHEKGVLHRDLKPANIRLTPEGRVKVLDFGLARALGDGEPVLDSRPSTVTSPPSHDGLVLGTAPYMSPEQARGQEVDRRSDVWAFGCVLYELLTGRRAFPGKTFSEAAAAILEREPDWGALPTGTPYALQRLIRRCLKKDREERLHDVADAGLELKELLAELSSGVALTGPGTPRPRPAKTATQVAAIVAMLTLAGVAVAGLLVYRSRTKVSPGSARQSRFQISLPRGVVIPGLAGPSLMAIAPDGDRIAFVGCKEGTCLLYVRDRRELDARPLPDTEGATCPFFSPDGRFIGFGANDKLKRVAIEGGPVLTLTDAAQLRGGSWGEDGTILFTRGNVGLIRVSANGGEARRVTEPDAGRYINHRWPHFLPGGRAALFAMTRHFTKATYEHDVAVVDLGTNQVRTIVEDAGSPRYAPSGHLLFGRRGSLYAAPFDLERLALTGTPVPILDDVFMSNSPARFGDGGGLVHYDLAHDGTLLFSPLEARLPKRKLVWVDRRGGRTSVSPTQRAYDVPALSPDGRRLAVSVRLEDAESSDGFVLDLERDIWTRFSSNGAAEFSWGEFFSWLPDGERFVVGSSRENRPVLLLARLDGTAPPELLVDGEAQNISVAPDGRSLLFCRVTDGGAQWDIWRLSLQGNREAQPWLATPSLEILPSFSPDGRFVAYLSEDSAGREVYVAPYPGPGPRYQVSTQGGSNPRWSRNGREIFFTSRGTLSSSAVRTSPTFAADPPRELFTLPDEIVRGWVFYDATADGQRFVMIEKDPLELRPIELVLVPNWVEELKARMTAMQ